MREQPDGRSACTIYRIAGDEQKEREREIGALEQSADSAGGGGRGEMGGDISSLSLLRCAAVVMF